METFLKLIFFVVFIVVVPYNIFGENFSYTSFGFFCYLIVILEITLIILKIIDIYNDASIDSKENKQNKNLVNLKKEDTKNKQKQRRNKTRKYLFITEIVSFVLCCFVSLLAIIVDYKYGSMSLFSSFMLIQAALFYMYSYLKRCILAYKNDIQNRND